MKLLRLVLFPFVPVYFLVTWLRNKFYDLGWKSSTTYDLPVICIGNLSVGGTGKTPMIEYLIKVLNDRYKTAVLSRGYKRTTKGFLIADDDATASTIGDEPFQFYRKFKDTTIAVDADRRHGIEELIKIVQPELILLDDAFQHRKVKAGFNILLTAYSSLYCDDFVLPTGNLREPRSGSKRADVIIVTKCPSNLSDTEKTDITKQLNPLPDQQVYFSSIRYSEEVRGRENMLVLESLKTDTFTLVTGIANPQPLIDHLKSKQLNFEHLKYKDHHNFSDEELRFLKSKPLIITTEKDYVRLLPSFKEMENLYYLPIEFEIDKSKKFEELVKNFVKTN